MNKLTYKNALYAYVRLSCWALVIILPCYIALSLMWEFLLKKHNIPRPAVKLIANLSISWLVYSIGLSKVFFKEYKNFSLFPKFQKVPVELIVLFVILELGLDIATDRSSYMNLDIIAPYRVIVIFCIEVLLEFFLLKCIIERKATVVNKREQKWTN